MLRLMSERWHEVLTGVALVSAESGRTATGLERTRVRFSAMSDEEIAWHVETGDVLDKAGAYAIQCRAALFIEAIEGDYWNVVGLPVRLVYELARGFDDASTLSLGSDAPSLPAQRKTGTPCASAFAIASFSVAYGGRPGSMKRETLITSAPCVRA